MTKKVALLLGVALITMVFAVVGCSSVTTTTVTQSIPPITFTASGTVPPAKTITLPGGVTTVPAVTITLPTGVTTILATTITVTATTVTQPAVPTTLVFLPSTPDAFPYGMAALTNCSDCHGPGLYAQYPLPPSWNGSLNGSLENVGIYIVVPGSIQDHTGRTDDQCQTCHQSQ